MVEHHQSSNPIHDWNLNSLYTRKLVKISQKESSCRCGRNEFRWSATAASVVGDNDGRERRRRFRLGTSKVTCTREIVDICATSLEEFQICFSVRSRSGVVSDLCARDLACSNCSSEVKVRM
ncbi:hypothetical protein F511_23558 [Dorcoceras hygrometricum]|uniref:Uncharacterized protein n=1 Tax=Dorcoceras hygrometricum TaxID=472368 RepID=A0A2Z7B5Z8_9LAMI|nr:hypothetical protein F511_23558 [Dorcoceras hygrometricum]